MDNHVHSWPQASSSARFSFALEYYGSDAVLPAGHVHGPSISECFIVQYCTCGCGEFEVDGLVTKVKSDQCMIIFPGQVYIERADQDDPWGILWISLSGESIACFFERLGITPASPVITHCEQSLILSLMQDIIKTADSTGFQRELLLGKHILELFDEFSRRYTAQSNSHATLHAQDSYVNQAIYYLDMHYSQKALTVEALAQIIGLNRSYLYEIFKAKTGLSPQEYLTRLRINKACEFLLLPQATVTSVAYSVGYEPLIFSKAFKRITGMSPSEYRRKKLDQ